MDFIHTRNFLTKEKKSPRLKKNNTFLKRKEKGNEQMKHFSSEEKLIKKPLLSQRRP